jgi:hypothetical protein
MGRLRVVQVTEPRAHENVTVRAGRRYLATP